MRPSVQLAKTDKIKVSPKQDYNSKIRLFRGIDGIDFSSKEILVSPEY